MGRRRDYAELLDRPGVPPDHLAQNLRHLRLMNRWLGWSAAVWAVIRPLLTAAGEATLLDVATGSGDVPRALVARARLRGIAVRAIGSDVSDAVLADAARQGGASLALVRHDATALPFADRSIDLVTCCLAAHHLAPAQLEQALAEMWRVCRRAVIVSDVERGRLAYIGARLVTLVLRDPLIAHDAPVSVMRAYTAAELASIARRAGLRNVAVRRRFPFRALLVARRRRAT